MPRAGRRRDAFHFAGRADLAVGTVLGTRSARNAAGTFPIFFRPTRSFAGRTLLAQWSAATLLGSSLCAGYIVRLAATDHPIEALACIAVVAATAGAALAFGTPAGASRPFEAVYLIVWYLGPINALPVVDFSGTIATAPVALTSICIGLTALFSSATAIARRVR
jgi:hypothetical protein